MATKANHSTAEGFVGSVFKFSISTFVNIGILGLSIVLTGRLISTALNGQITEFLTGINVVMTIATLGLDQAFIRYFHKTPGGISQNALFRLCFYFSTAFLAIAGVLCSTLFLSPLSRFLSIGALGPHIVPLLFLNALFYLVSRYFNVMLRMEMNILFYTVQSILMQFFYKLFYLLGAFFGGDFHAMVLFSTLGLGALAVGSIFLRRKALRPRLSDIRSGAYGTLLPYGFAIAPTAVFLNLNAFLPVNIINRTLGDALGGVYGFGYTLSNIVSMIQLGFAAFWGAYMFEHHATQQARIKKVHDFMNFAILVFFSFLVAFEDIIFVWIFPKFAQTQTIFPIMMLAAVFTILCETTVYGNAIAKRPIFDTIGIGLSFVITLVGCQLFVKDFGLYGAALSWAAGNFIMFVFRTFTAQKLYRTIAYPAKTIIAILLALALTLAGSVFASHFLTKLACCVAAIVIYCIIYRKELVRVLHLLCSICLGLLRRGKSC